MVRGKSLSRKVLLRTVSLASLVVCNTLAFAQDNESPVPDISVTAPGSLASEGGAAPASVAPEGSTAAGYKPSTVSNFGPFGKRKIEDVPYSVNVISSDLITNTLSSTGDDIYRISPVVTPWTAGGRGGNSPNIILRGFTTTNSSSLAEDGMRVQYLSPLSLEDKERVEIYTGLTSFLYGPANVGGLVNYVYKKPTQERLNDVTIGDYGGAQKFVHGDFGGQIDKEGRFAYRLNIVGEDGNTGVDHQTQTRALLSGALDWNITDRAKLTLFAKHEYLDIGGLAPYWSFPTNANGSLKYGVPRAPSGSNYYGQPWIHAITTDDRVGAELNWKINDIFTSRSSYAYTYTYLPAQPYENNTFTNAKGTYTQSIRSSFAYQYYQQTGYSFVDASIDTGWIHHNLTTGYFGNVLTTQMGAGTSASKSITGQTLDDPTYIPEAAVYGVETSRGVSSISANQNFVLGDEIKFNDWVSVLGGGTYSRIQVSNYTVATGSKTSQYDQGKLTPSASLIVKPLSWLTTYATYSEALEQGQSVPSTGSTVYTNAGQNLAPFVSKQYELGAKADVGGLLLTAALFDIDKALQLDVTNANGTHTYVQDGRQVNKGIELTATGNVVEGWRVMGGLTLLDPKIEKYQANPALDGNAPRYVSNTLAKLTTEYDLSFVRGLTLTGGIYYTGRAAADVTNTNYFPSYVTADLGLRYKTHLPTGEKVTFRLDVKNLTNEAYWLPAGYTGAPRTVAFSAELKF
jgi:iron complex outermembrane recepter protein